MRTIGEILRLSVDHVAKRGGRPRHEVEELIAHALGMKRLDLYLKFDRPIEEEEAASIRAGIARLAADEPLAYVLGTASFYGREFIVTPDVLIPRPETEVLVSVVEKWLVKQPSPGTIVDVGTGSGCIGLTLKALFPSWRVVLSDICEKALAIARRNAQKLQLDVELIQGDLLGSFSGRAECIVSNLPYLSLKEWNEADRSVSEFEPKKALLAGPTGLEVYQRLFDALQTSLVPEGLCAVEIGASQGPAVLALAQKSGTASLIQDFFGRDRVVELKKNSSLGYTASFKEERACFLR